MILKINVIMTFFLVISLNESCIMTELLQNIKIYQTWYLYQIITKTFMYSKYLECFGKGTNKTYFRWRCRHSKFCIDLPWGCQSVASIGYLLFSKNSTPDSTLNYLLYLRMHSNTADSSICYNSAYYITDHHSNIYHKISWNSFAVNTGSPTDSVRYT